MDDKYMIFTGPARLSKAINTLQGLITGINIDNEVNAAELETLANWIVEHEEFSEHHPFNEIIPLLQDALADNHLSLEEIEDIAYCCEKFSPKAGYYNAATAEMQRLQGVLGGILADGIVTEEEARGLSDWVDERSHLKSVWPYAEIDSILTEVLRDGKVDANEQDLLLRWFSEFSGLETIPAHPNDFGESRQIDGICAVTPEIRFEGHKFCFTGTSQRWKPRSQFEREITELGGLFSNRVVKDLTYLVVGSEGNKAWAYSCYGRKVEQAAKLRRDGNPVLIVHEFDVIEAAEDYFDGR